jgi:hypothetical protein
MTSVNTITIDDVKYVREDQVVPKIVEPVLTGDFVPFKIGAVYLIRTVTMADTGRVVAANDKWVVLENAAWVASTGRFSEALRKCEFNEVEPFPDGRVIIGAGSIIDAVEIASVCRIQK